MRHFVQYHHPDRDDHPCELSGEFLIYTNKPYPMLAGLLGNTVWLIAGEGTPRRYSLAYTFVVDEIGAAADPVFRWYARGSEGRLFEPPPRLDGDPWFGQFLRRNANFSLGLREMHENDVVQLSRMLFRVTA